VVIHNIRRYFYKILISTKQNPKLAYIGSGERAYHFYLLTPTRCLLWIQLTVCVVWKDNCIKLHKLLLTDTEVTRKFSEHQRMSSAPCWSQSDIPPICWVRYGTCYIRGGVCICLHESPYVGDLLLLVILIFLCKTTPSRVLSGSCHCSFCNKFVAIKESSGSAHIAC
jgi:hypothetical protein